VTLAVPDEFVAAPAARVLVFAAQVARFAVNVEV